MTKTLLFDYGGTLDTGACHWSYILHDGYRAAGIDLDEATFRTAYVYAERALARQPHIKPEDDFLALLRKKVAIEAESLQAQGAWSYPPAESAEKVEAVAAYCDRFARDTTQASARVLAQLADKYAMGIVSNFYGNLSTVLRTYGLDGFFSFVVESSVVGVRKPSPDIFALGVQRAGVLAEETLVIGDSYSKDIVPASTAGCRTVWFKGREWEEKQYDEKLPDKVITSLEELTEFL